LKRALLLLFVAGGAFLASANTTPVATISLDNGSPTKDWWDANYDWDYTVTVTGGDIDNVASFELFNLSGVTSAWTFNDGWSAQVIHISGGLEDVVFTNDNDPCGRNGCSLDGFNIESTGTNKGNANYTVTYSDNRRDDPSVGAPMAPATATPEPASVSLIGLPLLALAGFKARRKQRNAQ
jgi:hypothetical protein